MCPAVWDGRLFQSPLDRGTVDILTAPVSEPPGMIPQKDSVEIGVEVIAKMAGCQETELGPDGLFLFQCL